MRGLMASNLSDLVDHLLVVGRFVTAELRGGVYLSIATRCVDGGATLRTSADAAARVIDLSRQRIRSNVGSGHIDYSIPADCPAVAVINCEDRVALSCEISGETEFEIRISADIAAA